jgi:AraC-like DNA-binding protein
VPLAGGPVPSLEVFSPADQLLRRRDVPRCAGTAPAPRPRPEEPTIRWFRPVAPPPGLRHAVACTWTATVEGVHPLIPDGCLEVVWTDDGRCWVCGPETVGWRVPMRPGSMSVGVRFRPGAAAAALGLNVAEVANGRFDLADVVGGAQARRLAEQLTAARDDHARRALLETAAAGWVERMAADDVARVVADALAAGPLRVGELAEESTLSTRQLHRRCLASFGYGPSTLARILRFQRFLALAARHRWASAADLASSAGYADQSHLGRDSRALCGRAPTQVVAELAASSFDVRSVLSPPGGLLAASRP